jgi:hypothetical protein
LGRKHNPRSGSTPIANPFYPNREFVINIGFVKENLTFTGEDSPMSNLLLSVMGAFAQF